MISAIDTREFVPYGREYMCTHPGEAHAREPLVKALRDFSITTSAKRDVWCLREYAEGGTETDCDEELYTSDQTVVWSQGTNEGGGRVIKCFTLDKHIRQALWCSFLLPAEDHSERAHIQQGVCLIDDRGVNMFTVNGQDYKATLPFPISKAWPIRNGLLFAFEVNKGNKADTHKTPKRVEKNLPALYSMLHPLDEVVPVIWKTGAGKVSYVTEACIVFSSEEPSLVMMYDQRLSVHSVWAVRRAKQEEAFNILAPTMPMELSTDAMSSPAATGFLSKSTSHVSRFSTQSPSIMHSPFNSYSSKFNSPVASSSHIQQQTHLSKLNVNSPSLSLALLSRSPSLNAGRCLQSPSSPRHLRSMTAASPRLRTPQTPGITSADNTGINHEVLEPITPEVCLEHLWTEGGSLTRDGPLGEASKVFLTSDVCGRRYLCYLVSCRHQLRCVKFEESNDQSQLIFGSINYIHGTRDAAPLKSLDMMLVLDMTNNLVLYTGTVKMNKVHVSGLPTPMNLSLGGAGDDRYGPCTSSRPPSALGHVAGIDDEAPMLSPVPTEMNESTQLLEASISEEPLSFVAPFGQIKAIKDPVNNRFTLELHDGSLYRTSLPPMTSSPVICICLAALRQVLPRDSALLVITRWYSSHNAPGSTNGQSAWQQFVRCLLGLMGYDTARLALTRHHHDNGDSLSPVLAPKKAKPSEQETDEDWLKLSSSSHAAYLGVSVSPGHSTPGVMDTNALLFPHIPALLFALHLVYEELKLNLFHLDDHEDLASLLHHLASDLHCDLYTDHYCRDHPALLVSTEEHSQITKEPLEDIVWSKFLKKVSGGAGYRSPDLELTLQTALHSVPASATAWERVVLFMAQLGVTKDVLRMGFSLPLKEAIFHCRSNPPGDWPKEAYQLVGREDLSKQHENQSVRVGQGEDEGEVNKQNKEEEDGMDNMNKDLLKLRFNEDLRLQEVRRLLQSSKPVRIFLTQRPEVSDHDFIEEQERHLYATCIRTMALPVGRGIFAMCTYHPVPTEMLPVPTLCLTGRAPPRNTTVDLTHIDTPPNMSHWPQFHNGVAAGLRIANSSELNSTWIVYNKPKSSELTNEHAGFLMGLGLNGHLKSLDTLIVHDYLARGHEMTSVGVLLGISAGLRGTMDVATTRLLSIHLPALLPPTSTELVVTHNVQVAAVLGMGLIYQGTAHRHIAEVLLSEIGRPPGPEMENCTDRESYSLSSGLALGMVMLGKGSQVGLSDLSMADELYHYMVGGHKRPLTGANKERYKSPSYQIKEGDAVNVDVTSPGATLALGMMFFKTNNDAVADWLEAPDTQYLLDFVRPDFLMLRVISRGLVLWDSIEPSEKWIFSNVPAIVYQYAFNKMKYADDPDSAVDFETMSQGYLNIVGGACMVLGLRYAGSANNQAFTCLYHQAKQVLELLSTPVLVEQAGKSTAENCLLVIVIALAMVMAGTGSLEVLRLCKHLRSRVGPSNTYVLYGSHMAVSMALAMLFMGGGRYSLSTQPEAVAALLCAFFPKFPIHSNDNRYHLQAFRHLYVLAAEPRALLPTDVDSERPCYVPVQIKLKSGGDPIEMMAPCILPELSLLQQVSVQGPRYWPVTFQVDNNWDTLRQILSGCGCLYVKQRAGHLSYAADPKGYHSVLSQSLTMDQPLGKVIEAEDIESFSSDPQMLAFAELFCRNTGEKEYEVCQLLSKLLYECVSQEKTHILAIQIAMYQAVRVLELHPRPLLLWQVKLMTCFYSRFTCTPTPLMSIEFLTALKNMVDDILQPWQKRSAADLVGYFSGENISQHSMLAAFLVWFNIPPPSVLAQLGLKGPPSFPDLFQHLSRLGLGVSSIHTLATVLQRIAAR